MELRNLTFMFYGFLAAWLIVLLYVITLARRNARLKKELEDVKNLVAATQSEGTVHRENRIR
jgi:CcmD family protein